MKISIRHKITIILVIIYIVNIFLFGNINSQKKKNKGDLSSPNPGENVKTSQGDFKILKLSDYIENKINKGKKGKKGKKSNKNNKLK